MANSEQTLDVLLQEIEQEQDANFVYDRSSIERDIELHAQNRASLAIKVLTILGGLLGTSTFLGFFVAAGLYDSPVSMLVVGVMLLIGAEWLIKVKKDATIDSIGVALTIAGYFMLGIGVQQVTHSNTAVASVLGLVAVLLLIFSESKICVFISVLVLAGSLLSLLFILKVAYLVHGLTAALGALLTYISLNEAKLIATYHRLNLMYSPIRIGVVFSLALTLGLTVHQKFLSANIGHLWISSMVLIIFVLILLTNVLKHTTIIRSKTKAICYACGAVLLVPFILTPSVPGALLILLSSFYMGNKFGFWVGLLALVYFIVLYYYDLNMTLLAKSGIMIASGLLFLGVFVLLNRYLKSYAD
jgi:hypothetical protein